MRESCLFEDMSTARIFAVVTELMEDAAEVLYLATTFPCRLANLADNRSNSTRRIDLGHHTHVRLLESLHAYVCRFPFVWRIVFVQTHTPFKLMSVRTDTLAIQGVGNENS